MKNLKKRKNSLLLKKTTHQCPLSASVFLLFAVCPPAQKDSSELFKFFFFRYLCLVDRQPLLHFIPKAFSPSKDYSSQLMKTARQRITFDVADDLPF